MTTEEMLLQVHKAPVIRLADICEPYLNNTYAVAQRRASLNALPFPVYKLGDSKKAPWMVRIDDLAGYLDTVGSQAKKQWEMSQV